MSKIFGSVGKVHERITAVLEKHGIKDKKEQQELIIEIINAFTGR